MAEKSRPGVMIYFEIETALQLLDDVQRGKLFSAIIEYGHYGVIPSFDDRALDIVWSFVKVALDRDGASYATKIRQKKIAGLTSEFKNKYAPKHKLDPDDPEALQDYINQRMSTDVNMCPPTTTTSSAPASSSSTISDTALPIIPKISLSSKGVSEREEKVQKEERETNYLTATSVDFETKRKQQIQRVKNYSGI